MPACLLTSFYQISCHLDANRCLVLPLGRLMNERHMLSNVSLRKLKHVKAAPLLATHAVHASWWAHVHAERRQISACTRRQARRDCVHRVQAGVPKHLWGCHLALVVAPPSTPLPTSMLALLWGTSGPAEAEATAAALAKHGVLRTARLEDGSAWSLPQPEFVGMLQVAAPSARCDRTCIPAWRRGHSCCTCACLAQQPCC